MAVLVINGKVMPTPSTMKWDIESFDRDSGRGLDGTMQRTMICQKEKLSLTWRAGALSMDEVSLLLNEVMTEYFSVTYFSPLANATVTKEFYVGTRSTNFYSIIDGKPIIDEISMNFIQR